MPVIFLPRNVGLIQSIKIINSVTGNINKFNKVN